MQNRHVTAHIGSSVAPAFTHCIISTVDGKESLKVQLQIVFLKLCVATAVVSTAISVTAVSQFPWVVSSHHHGQAGITSPGSNIPKHSGRARTESPGVLESRARWSPVWKCFQQICSNCFRGTLISVNCSTSFTIFSFFYQLEQFWNLLLISNSPHT